MTETVPIRLVVGLGNPGVEYKNTRHNAGWRLADRLAARAGVFFRSESKFSGETARVTTRDGDVWLLKPTTFMNASGRAVQAMSSYFRISPGEVLVIHDELDLVPGCMRLKFGGGNAGHNGLKDISEKLGTAQFWRLRIGIGHPRQFCPQQPVYDWVLSAPGQEHRDAISTCLDAAEKLLPALAGGRIDNVQRSIRKFASLPRAEKAEPAKISSDGNRPAVQLPFSLLEETLQRNSGGSG